MSEDFRGPVGIWPWPFINLILRLFGGRGSRVRDKGTAMRRTSVTEIKRTSDGWTILEHQQ